MSFLVSGESKTLMFFEGCATHLGCTISLRGASSPELQKVRLYRIPPIKCTDLNQAHPHPHIFSEQMLEGASQRTLLFGLLNLPRKRKYFLSINP